MIDRNTIDKEIKRFEPTCKIGTSEHWAYRALITAPAVGPFHSQDDAIEKIAKFWKLNWRKEHQLHTQIRRAFNNRVWRYGKRYQKHFLCGEIYADGLGLVIGCAVLVGHIKRHKK